MKTSIIIPSRLASTRLPQKPLAEILGKSLIMRVYDQAAKVKNADVIVATDHESIANHVLQNGGKVVLTSVSHPSGTDRVAEVAAQTNSDIIINLQGDEPLVDPRQIDELIELMSRPDVFIGTQCKLIEDGDILFDYNVVKVVRDYQDRALYFSRQALPAFRDIPYQNWMGQVAYFRHIGIYGFKRDTLLQLCSLPQTSYEKSESLEQLRWMQHGFPVHCVETSFHSIGVDTPEDLEKVRNFLITEMFR